MSGTKPPTEGSEVGQKNTLGDLLYADRTQPPILEQEWARLVSAIGAGDQHALHELYQRTHRLVFTLTFRITNSRETAEELTLDVFYDVWRRAAKYDPAGGTVLGWIMNQARSRAIDRLRFEQRKKRRNSSTDLLETQADTGDAFDLVAQRSLLIEVLKTLSSDERLAIESAFYSGLTYAEVATNLNQPLGTIKTRIRTGLGKLRNALEAGTKTPK